MVKEELVLEGNDIWVEGIPATFATKGEKPWKNTLFNSLAFVENVDCDGIELKFYLPSLVSSGHPLDVDNLCEPVFSTIVGRLGWFQGRRPNLRWWSTSKEEANQTGLRIILGDTVPVKWLSVSGELIFDSIYNGELPRKATDPMVPKWIKDSNLVNQKDNDRFALQLMFGNPKLNIAEIADGRVKNLIDCLYPILGGGSGTPEDWRIDSLLVQKGVSSLSQSSVRILIWRSGDSA